MPRIVRNFWIKGRADGRDSAIKFGPNTSKTAGFELTVLMRHNGGIVEACDLLGRVDDAGNITLRVQVAGAVEAHIGDEAINGAEIVIKTKR